MIAVLQQEADEWKAKFQTEKQEVLCLSGASSKQNRKVQALEEEADALKATVAEYSAKYSQKPAIGSLRLSADSRPLADLRVEYDQLKTEYDLRNSEAENIEAQLLKARTEGKARDEDLAALRTQLSDAQQNNMVLQDSSDPIQ